MNVFGKIFGALTPACHEAARFQSEALEGPLSPAKRIGLRVHLLMCKWCRRYGRQIEFLHKAAGEHPEEMTKAGPQELSQEARERMKQRLRVGK